MFTIITTTLQRGDLYMMTDIKWWLDDNVKIVDTGDRLIALDGWNGTYYDKCFEVNDILDDFAYGVVKSNLSVKQTEDGKYVLMSE